MESTPYHFQAKSWSLVFLQQNKLIEPVSYPDIGTQFCSRQVYFLHVLRLYLNITYNYTDRVLDSLPSIENYAIKIIYGFMN